MASSEVPACNARSLSGLMRAALFQIDPYLFLVALLPFAILACYRSWLITFPDLLDPWYSIAYFLDLPGSLRLCPDYYVSDRLAYWIPGSTVFHLFPPLLANHV